MKELANQPQTTGDRPLAHEIGQSFILAYKEDTALLASTLTQEGLPCSVLRQTHQPHYNTYSPSYLCLLNHKDAWMRATKIEKPTLIVEADFVPVQGIGHLPMPFDPQSDHVGITWLYTCAPQLYSVSSQGFAEGFSTSMVAYIVTPLSARHLLELADQINLNPGPENYSSWDSTIDTFLRHRGFKNHLPFRNYGEHGGLPNLEHRRAGLSTVHRADVLYGRLAFLPPYVTHAKHPALAFFLARMKARLKGILRLFFQKYLRLKVVSQSSVPTRLIKFSLSRHLTFIL
jgi:hypothetical protein